MSLYAMFPSPYRRSVVRFNAWTKLPVFILHDSMHSNHLFYLHHARLFPSLQWSGSPTQSSTAVRLVHFAQEAPPVYLFKWQPPLLLLLVTARANYIFDYTTIMCKIHVYLRWTDELRSRQSFVGGVILPILGELGGTFCATCEGPLEWPVSGSISVV